MIKEWFISHFRSPSNIIKTFTHEDNSKISRKLFSEGYTCIRLKHTYWGYDTWEYNRKTGDLILLKHMYQRVAND